MTDSRPAPSLRRWFFILLALGILWRLIRYALAFPVWGDEGAVGVNIITRTYTQLLQPLEFNQVAPLGFLWVQRAVYEILGMSEYAMRLIPTIAGIAAIILFACWARLLLSPVAATIAVGVMAVSYYTASYAVELKPYGIDLLAAVSLLLLATLFILRREPAWLVLLTLITPLCLFMSYPAVFVAGGVAISLVLSLRPWKTRDALLIALYGLVLLASFFFLFHQVGKGQYDRTAHDMTNYWSDAFPPANPIHFIWWFIQVHTGRIMAYPVGDKNFGSTLSFLFFLVGLTVWWRSRPVPLTCLLLGPFLLTLIAAALSRYPYGDNARVDQHFAPAIVLLISLGIAHAIDRFVAQPSRCAAAYRIVFLILVAFGVGGIANNIIWPYRVPGEQDARRIIRGTLCAAGPNALVAVRQERIALSKTIQWYLLEREERLIFNAFATRSLHNFPGPLWVLNFDRRTHSRHNIEVDIGRPADNIPVPPVALYGYKEAPLLWEFLYFPPTR